jgi:hypothetical protein
MKQSGFLFRNSNNITGVSFGHNSFKSYRMRKLKVIGFLSVFVLFSSNISAQDHAIGLRFSDDVGITYKQHIKGKTWGEVIGHIGDHSLALSGLYEAYNQTPFSKSFKWYYGGGIYLGVYSNHDDSNFFGGIRGVLGLCYQFSDIPFDISLDWMPTITLFNNYGTDFILFGLSLRYTF